MDPVRRVEASQVNHPDLTLVARVCQTDTVRPNQMCFTLAHSTRCQWPGPPHALHTAHVLGRTLISVCTSQTGVRAALPWPTLAPAVPPPPLPSLPPWWASVRHDQLVHPPVLVAVHTAQGSTAQRRGNDRDTSCGKACGRCINLALTTSTQAKAASQQLGTPLHALGRSWHTCVTRRKQCGVAGPPVAPPSSE